MTLQTVMMFAIKKLPMYLVMALWEHVFMWRKCLDFNALDRKGRSSPSETFRLSLRLVNSIKGLRRYIFRCYLTGLYTPDRIRNVLLRYTALEFEKKYEPLDCLCWFPPVREHVQHWTLLRIWNIRNT